MITRDTIVVLWKDLVNWYLMNCRNWHGLLRTLHSIKDLRKSPEILDMAYGLWGCVWHEHDLVLAFAHRLTKYIESGGFTLHVHVLYKLKPANFRIFRNFSRSLYEAVKSARSALGFGRKWYPEVDLIVATDEPPFLLCLEFKYLHYLPTTWNVANDLRRKVVMLKTLKEHKVCTDAGVLLLDDALCRKDLAKCRELVKILEEASKELFVLSHHVTYDELLSIVETVIKVPEGLKQQT